MTFPHPVRVRRTRMPRGLEGDCRLKGGFFLVRVEKSLPEHSAIDTMLHEMGHCLSWGQDDDSHGPSWGTSYSTVYRKFLEWLEAECNT